jgi:hypothetical protein
MRMLTRKHTSPHRTPYLNYFNRTATNKDAIKSIEYNNTTLAVIGSKSAGILPDRDIPLKLWDVSKAHEMLEKGEVFGKILLSVR